MNDDINLISESGSPQHVYNRLFLFTAISFGAVFLVALLLTFYSFILKAQAGSLTEDVSEAKNKIASMADVRQKVLTVSERIDTARKIVSNRSSLEFQTARILASIPDNFSIDTISAQNDIVKVTLGSSDLSAFDDLLEVQLAELYEDEDLALKKIESASFTRSGNYELTLAFYFGGIVSE